MTFEAEVMYRIGTKNIAYCRQEKREVESWHEGKEFVAINLVAFLADMCKVSALIRELVLRELSKAVLEEECAIILWRCKEDKKPHACVLFNNGKEEHRYESDACELCREVDPERYNACEWKV